jgi:hypothetical protein
MIDPTCISTAGNLWCGYSQIHAISHKNSIEDINDLVDDDMAYSGY